MKALVDKYYVESPNMEDRLKNGSFVRRSSRENDYARYMNGDFMNLMNTVPEGFILVNTEWALSLIPKVCGGRA